MTGGASSNARWRTFCVVDGDPSLDILAAADRGRHRRVVKDGIAVSGQ